jgi:hypothetical protein
VWGGRCCCLFAELLHQGQPILLLPMLGDPPSASRKILMPPNASGNPAWLVHAEKGDGGLTDAERATLEAAPNVTLVKIPGAVFFLPDEAPQQTAEVIASAVAQAT